MCVLALLCRTLSYSPSGNVTSAVAAERRVCVCVSRATIIL
jgi:hypothetical protein